MNDKTSWKHSVVILLLLLSALSISYCTAKPEFPTGVFIHESSGDIINLQDDGTFTASGHDGVLYISGTYTIDSNNLTVNNSDEILCESKLPEIYTWTFDGSILTFLPINENACLLRGEINLIMQK